MTDLAAEKIDSLIKNKKNNHLFKLQVFASSFDRRFRELMLLQQAVLQMLQDTVKSIKSNK